MLDHLTTPPVFGDPRLPARFWEKVNEHGPIPTCRPDLGPCWQWVASLDGHGYGHFGKGNGSREIVRAHRWAYQHLIGPIPHGLDSDHLCRNRACVNPAHIESVIHRENVLRGKAPSARAAKRTHCPQGHPYDEANTYIWRRSRACRTCRRLRGGQIYYSATRKAWLAAHRDYLREYKREWARQKSARNEAQK